MLSATAGVSDTYSKVTVDHDPLAGERWQLLQSSSISPSSDPEWTPASSLMFAAGGAAAAGGGVLFLVRVSRWGVRSRGVLSLLTLYAVVSMLG